MEIADAEALALLYEEYNCAPDPTAAPVRQAKALFDAECRKLYAAESAELREKWALPQFVAVFVIPELNRTLKRRADNYPTIQPERRRET